MAGKTSDRDSLAKVDWRGIPPAAAEVIWAVTTTACRASPGGCWCGLHASYVEGVARKAKSALDELLEEEAEKRRRGE